MSGEPHISFVCGRGHEVRQPMQMGCPTCGRLLWVKRSQLPISRLSPLGGGPNPWGNRAR